MLVYSTDDSVVGDTINPFGLEENIKRIKSLSGVHRLVYIAV